MRTRQISQSRLIPQLDRPAILLACATLVAAGVVAAHPVQAQSAPADQSRSGDTGDAYRDQTLRAFAGAAASVLQLRGHYYARIRAAEIAGSPAKAEGLHQEMRVQMRAAISQQGLTEEQYRSISSAAKADPALHAQINAIIQGAPPAQQQIREVTRITPPPPQVAAAPPAPAPAAGAVAPATPQADREAATAADDGSRQRLEAELNKVNDERDNFRNQQSALQAQVDKLERDLAAVQEQDSALRQQLTDAKKQAQAQQKKNQAKLAARADEIAGLKQQLDAAKSSDLSLREALDVERTRAAAAQASKEQKLAAFRHQIKQLAGRLAAAQLELDSLAIVLAPGDNAEQADEKSAFETLTPLQRKPTSIERVLERVHPQLAARQARDDEIARIEAERARREVERQALRREIANLSGDLTATYQAMAELIGEPANLIVATTELDSDYGTKALDFSQETAELFQTEPAQRAPATAQAQRERDQPIPLGAGDTVIEPRAPESALRDTLEPGDITTLRINPPPALQIATASLAAGPAANGAGEFDGLPATATELESAARQSAHPIVRDQTAFEQDATPPTQSLAATGQDLAFKPSVRGGADAYRAGDFRRAYDIWASLAQAGNRSAQFHLGALYFEGRGIAQNFAQSHFWLRVSAYQGDQRARALLATVAAELNSAEINASDSQAREWLQRRSIEVTEFKRSGKNRL